MIFAEKKIKKKILFLLESTLCFFCHFLQNTNFSTGLKTANWKSEFDSKLQMHHIIIHRKSVLA